MATLESKLLQAEARMKCSSGSSGSGGLAFNTRGHHNFSRKDDNVKGSYGGQGKDIGSRKFAGKCHYCDKVGHRKQDCFKWKRDQGSNEQSSSSDHQALSLKAMASAAVTGRSSSSDVIWYGDSGATDHMCPYRELFSSLEAVDMKVETATGHFAPVLGKGTVEVFSRGKLTSIEGVLLVPSISNCLLSLSLTASRGNEIVLKDDGLKIMTSRGIVIGTGKLTENRLYAMDFHPVAPVSQVNAAVVQPKDSSSLELWHRRLAHVNVKKVKEAIGFNGPSPEFDCLGCIYGKSNRLPFPKDGKKRADLPGDLIHVDIAGPMETSTPRGSRFFLLLKDDCSGFMFFYSMKKKSETFDCIEKFLLQDWKNLTTKYQINRFRSDNGSEFKSKRFQELLRKQKISQEFSAPYMPEQNGYIERSMRTVTEAARAMIHGANVAKFLWAEAVNTAVHVLNRLPLTPGCKSPLEIVTSVAPTFDHLKVFGSKVFIHVRDGKRAKWDAKTKETILVGYDMGSKSLRVWDPKSRTVIVSRDIAK